MTEMGHCNLKIAELPEKLEVMEYNADEDVKLSKLCTKKVLAKIEDTRQSIKKVEAVIKDRTNVLVHFTDIAKKGGQELQNIRDTIGTDNIRLKGLGQCK